MLGTGVKCNKLLKIYCIFCVFFLFMETAPNTQKSNDIVVKAILNCSWKNHCRQVIVGIQIKLRFFVPP